VQLIGPGSGHNGDLPAGALAVLGAIGVFNQVVLAHGIHSQQLPLAPVGVMNWPVEFPPTQSMPLIIKRLVSWRLPATEKPVKPLPWAILEVLLITPTLSDKSCRSSRPLEVIMRSQIKTTSNGRSFDQLLSLNWA